MISVSHAMKEILARSPLLGTEVVSLAEAFGRILGETVCSPTDLPAFDRSAMDGYAVLKDDPSEVFQVLGEARAGEACGHRLAEGQAVRIFTGAMVPEGAGRVLIQEDTAPQPGGKIRVLRRSEATHIRKRGEDARAGSVLLQEGLQLGAVELALMAGVGKTAPALRCLPRVAHLVSGDELVDPGREPVGAEIRDSNSILIRALVSEAGGEMVLQERVPDGLEPSQAALRKIGEDAHDVLLVSGGASVGRYDFGKDLLRSLNYEIHFEQVDLRPGKPLVFASKGKQLAFILPGNPVSHWVVFELFLRPLLGAMMGRVWSGRKVQAILDREFSYKPNARPTYWPGRARWEGERVRVVPLSWQSSGDLAGVAGSNALIVMPSMAGPQPRGAEVKVELLRGLGD